jgi:hypothetical protein
MMPDPDAMNSVDWLEIGKWLTRIWVYFFCIVGFAFTLLTAHALIPSLVSTGHIPKELADRVRPPMYATAVVLLAAIGFFLALTVGKAHHIENFYDRWWI